MKPKKYSEFKKGISDEVGLHPEVVDDFVSFYYAQVRKALSNLTAVHIYVENLGTFSLKKQKLEKAIKRNKSILGNLKKMTYKGMEKTHAVNDKLKMQEEALKMLNEAIEKKLEFKNKKNESK